MIGAAVAKRPWSKHTYPTRANAYYVAPNGSDSNAGSLAAPFASITKAQTAMQSGNKITYIRSGNAFLSAAITSAATSLTVLSIGNMPTTGTYYVLIDQEVLHVTAGAGTTTWTVARAQNNTTAAAHSANAVVSFVYIISARLGLGSSDANTTYSNYPGELAVLDGNANTTGIVACGLAGGSPQGTYSATSNVWINGIRFQNTANTAGLSGFDGANAPAVQAVGFSGNLTSNIKVTNCEFTRINPLSVSTYGAVVMFSAYLSGQLEVSNCYAHDQIGATAFQQAGSPAPTGPVNFTDNTANNVLQNNYDTGGIGFSDDGFTNSFAVVARNRVSNLNHGQPNPCCYYYLDNASANVTIFGNVGYGTGDCCMLLHGSNGTTISNNVFDISSLTDSVWEYQAMENTTMANNTYYSNIVYTGVSTQPKSSGITGYLGSLDSSQTATFTASFSGSTMTVSGTVSGLPLLVGTFVGGSGLPGQPFKISSLGTGTGGAGTYTMNQSASGTSVACTAYSPNGTAPVSGSNLHYGPSLGANLTNSAWDDDNQTSVANWHGSDITNSNPSFRNAGSNDYTLAAGSSAFSLGTPFLPVKPGGSTLLAGLPPVFTARPNNVIRTPDPNTGSALPTIGSFNTPPTGGTLPTNWTYYATSGLSTAIYYLGYAQDGQPMIRVRFYGTTTSSGGFGIMFDGAAPVTIGVIHTGYLRLCVCGGTMKNVTALQLFIQDTSTNTALGATSIAITGIPQWVSVPCTAGSSVSTIRFFLLASAANTSAIDVMFEVGSPQVVH